MRLPTVTVREGCGMKERKQNTTNVYYYVIHQLRLEFKVIAIRQRRYLEQCQALEEEKTSHYLLGGVGHRRRAWVGSGIGITMALAGTHRPLPGARQYHWQII